MRKIFSLRMPLYPYWRFVVHVRIPPANYYLTLDEQYAIEDATEGI